MLMMRSLIVEANTFRKRGAGKSRCPVSVVALAGVGLLLAGGSVRAENAVSCGGFAMLGGAQLACSHVAPKQPTQFCTFSWTLMTLTNTMSTVTGSFMVPPGTTNATVYQGAGFNAAMSNPIVLCQGKKSR